MVHKRSDASATLKFTVAGPLIDYASTKVMWGTSSDTSQVSLIAELETSQVMTYQLVFFGYDGKEQSLPADTPVGILFDSSTDLNYVSYSVSQAGQVSVVFG